MKYQGGKYRLSSDISKIINRSIARIGCREYVEPMCGALSVTVKIKAQSRLASDVDRSLITMWSAVKNGWVPPSTLSEDQYAELRSVDDPRDPLTAFAAYGCSFGGKRWGGYARAPGQDCAAIAQRSVMRKSKHIRDVRFECVDYLDLEPADCVVYCDPPYRGTMGYGSSFDHDEFWQWTQRCADAGCAVFVSEYEGPEWADVVWEKARKVTISGGLNGRANQAMEKLFIVSR